MNWMFEPVREAVMTILIVTAPIVLVAAGIGLVVGIIQAATQVQEQTTSFALKLVGVLGIFLVTGMWMFGSLTDFTTRTIGASFTRVLEQREPVEFPVDTAAQTFAKPFESEPLGQTAGNNGSFQASLAPPLQAFNNAIQTQSATADTDGITAPITTPPIAPSTQKANRPPSSFKPATPNPPTRPTSRRQAGVSPSGPELNKVELQPTDTVSQPLKIIRPVIPTSLELGNNNDSIDRLPPPGSSSSQGISPVNGSNSSDGTTTWW